MHRFFVRLSVLLAAATLLMPLDADAATFRVTTKVYEGPSLDPADEHTILFDDGLAYDLPQIENRFVTVFDPAQKRVTLLDRQERLQATVTTDLLLQYTAQMRATASTPQEQEQWGLNAKVEKSTQVIGYTVQFGNLEYHATTQNVDDPVMAADYKRFAILAARLNILRRLGPPPFGRMTLSEHIAAKSELPLETTLTVHRGADTTFYRSTHEVETLTDNDRKQINEVRGMLQLYRDVDLNDFPR